MADKNYTALAIGGALIAGVAIGAAIGSRSSHEIAAVAQRVAAVEASVEERLTAVGADVEQMVAAAAPGDALSAIESRAAALEQQVEAMASEAASATADQMKAVEDRVATMANQMAALIGRVNALGNGAAAPATAPAESAPPAAEPAPAAASASAPADDGADAQVAALQARLGERGAALSPGQTATFGEAAVFLSRIDRETGDARVLVVGSGPVVVGPNAGTVSLSGGCELTLLGVADGRAFLTCGE
jgi:hypothetical protein